MMILTASNIVRAISKLPRNKAYDYIAKATTTKLRILTVVEPEGPIFIERYDPSKGKGASSAKKQTISAAMVRRVANAITPGHVVNLDRVLGASYNTRSALEALMAHTPEFQYCYPGRIENFESSSLTKKGHKHLIWLPDEPHAAGVVVKREVHGMAISEISSRDAVYDALVLPAEKQPPGIPGQPAVSEVILRRHAYIQVALLEIGRQLGFRTWVAQNDKGNIYNGKKVGEMDGVVVRLQDVQLLSSFGEAIRAALLIDVIWFRNGRLMPAVIEIEHTTGVTSGLTRMKNFQDRVPPVPTRWVIAASDEDRNKVMTECNKPQFRGMRPQFFPYSAIDELKELCGRRKIRGVTEDFLDCFMEPCVPALQ